MSDTLQTSLLVAVAVVSLLALALAVMPFRDAVSRRRATGDSPLPTDLGGLRREVERLRGESAGTLRHVAVVRYDAFGDLGGALSFSIALLDDGGDGLVLTCINGRSDTRTYAKGIAGGRSETALSPEEQEAVDSACAPLELLSRARG